MFSSALHQITSFLRYKFITEMNKRVIVLSYCISPQRPLQRTCKYTMFLEHTINAAAQKKVQAKYVIAQNQRRSKGRTIKLKHLTLR